MIYTSYFGNLKKLEGQFPGMVFISISGKAPDWFLSDYRLEYRKLAPKVSWWKIWKDKFAADYESAESVKWYTEAYKTTVLDRLNAHQVKCDLYEMASKRNVCILCYEPIGKFCHRHLVQAWLNSYGIKCVELTA